MVRKNFTSCCHDPAPRADKIQRQGQGLSSHWTHDTWWTCADKHMADNGGQRAGGKVAAKEDSKQTPSGTQGGHMVETWQSGLKADTKRTNTAKAVTRPTHG